ncbi:hypothetical protein D3Y57_04725 (plasmid) [Sphingomonas paeninsulae]|uniref:Uncharacterized protein n=1 Tax=Sphingomonas paeninsulae TaxID=2319844 RepID=A0A494TDI2_SPHPE|nr:hypothetical protein [Sphingomonas paeninsulae]AYJ85324.1 hypothetical protein D3Y57_04725 [Sphingomonas paeninsulae]
MNDMRQGVTQIQHTVLDLLESVRNDGHGHDTQLFLGEKLANHARVNVGLRFKRDHAIQAAARLIDVAEQLDVMISAGDA